MVSNLPTWASSLKSKIETKWGRNPEIVATLLTLTLAGVVVVAIVLGVLLAHTLFPLGLHH